MSKTYLKGITLEINGKTDKLANALEDVNKKSKDIETELKEVNKLLKFDPKNSELLAQKQKLLGDAISTNKEKLEVLKKAEAQARDEFAKGKISEEQYRALQREITETEQKLKGLETQARKANGVLTEKQALNNLKDMGKAVAVVTGAFVAGTVGSAIAAGEFADEINTLAKQTGLSVEEIQKFKYASDRIDVSLETLTGSMAKLTRNMNSARDGNKATSEAFDALGVSVVDSNGKLRDNNDVFQEAIKALGEVENATERDALAMAIFGKSAQDLNPLILGGADALKTMGDEAKAAGLIMSQDTLDKANQFSDGMDELKAVSQGIFLNIGVEATQILLPALTDLLTFLKELPIWIEKNEWWLTLVGIAMGTLITALIAYNVHAAWGAISTWTLTTATSAWGAALAFVTSPITLTILAIGALIAIGVLLWKNWDTVSQKAKQVFQGIKDFIGDIVDGIGNSMKKMANGVIDALNFLIKGANKLQFDIPDWVPLLGGKKFGLNIPMIPKFDVGTKFLPKDMLVMAHEGEMIVPKKENPYANSGGNILPQFDIKEMVRAIVRGLERANIIAVIDEREFNYRTDQRIINAY
jgi:phage-related minor tail protein